MTYSRAVQLLATAIGFLTGLSTISLAQSRLGGDTALTYQWVHTNAQPGNCGCFGLNGGGLSASINAFSHLAAVVDVSGAYEGRGTATGNTLTLVSYLAGSRFYLLRPEPHPYHRLQPFAQVLLGAAHAGGGIAGAGDGTYAFAARAGAGLDLPVKNQFSIRLIQADYFLTNFENTTNNHQNNILLGAGAVFHWSR